VLALLRVDQYSLGCRCRGWEPFRVVLVCPKGWKLINSYGVFFRGCIGARSSGCTGPT